MQVIHVDNRLASLLTKEMESEVTETQFCQALKGYKLEESLLLLGRLSAKLYDNKFLEDGYWKKVSTGFIIHKETEQYITDFAIEYISNLFLISGANGYKSLSLADKSNIIGVFGVYFNQVVRPKKVENLASLLVPMSLKQLSSQKDFHDVFTRQFIMFQEIHSESSRENKMDLIKIMKEKTGLTLEEYFKLSFFVFAKVLSDPYFRLEAFTDSKLSRNTELLSREKVTNLLNLLAATPEEIRVLDRKYNNKLCEEHTLSRYNPLWEKPIIKLAKNSYVVPSLSSYVKGAFKGIYWLFENADKPEFRKYFGSLFENYVGRVLKDIYGEEKVCPGIKYGTKRDSREFYDWIVELPDSLILIEAKSYQFPLPTLQTGEPSLVEKEVSKKIVETIRQMFDRKQDIEKYDGLQRFRKKKITCLAIYYDIPFVSTDIYDMSIKSALHNMEKDRPGICDFAYIMLDIEEIEQYSYVKDYIGIENLVRRSKETPGSGIQAEIRRIFVDNKHAGGRRKNLLDRKLKEFAEGLLPS